MTDYRTFDAYGREVTPIDVRTRLHLAAKAKAAASASPVLAALAALNHAEADGYEADGTSRPHLVAALHVLADAVRVETPEQFAVRMERRRRADNAELHRRNLVQDQD